MRALGVALIATIAASAAFGFKGPEFKRDRNAPVTKRTWEDVKKAIDRSIARTAYGYFCYSQQFNDIGPIDTSGTLSAQELKTQFAMACILASPVTVNGGKIDENLEKWLTDKMLMNVNNDFVARQGHVVLERSGVKVIVKYLWGMNGGTFAVAFYNPGDAAAEITITPADVSLKGKVSWTDRFNSAEKGSFTDEFTVKLPAHGTELYMFQGRAVMREEYRRECAFEKDGALLWNCVYAPRDAKYFLAVETDSNEPYQVRINGLVDGWFRGPAKFRVSLFKTENSIRIEGAGASAVKKLRVSKE